MIVRRSVLVVEDRKVHTVLIKMALRRLDEWVEVRWVRDPVEAREALDGESDTDLVLFSTGEDERATRRSLRTLVPDWMDAPVVAVVFDKLTREIREGLADYPVTLLAHPLKAGDLGALLHAAAMMRIPLPVMELQHRK